MARRASKSAAGGDAGDPSLEQMPFEKAVAELEALIDRIEQGEIGLEESLRQFKRGDALVRRCRTILDAAELQVRELSPDDRAAPSSGGDHEDSDDDESAIDDR